MRFGSVCSGIEAASVAWGPLGWQSAWFAEIEPFPSAVLAHHYPSIPNLGDMSRLPEAIRAGTVEAPDLLCGGTPCQAFSVAGLRRSLDDARGNLTLTFVEIADAIDAVRLGRGQDRAVVFWENVPGVLNTPDNAFGCFLGALAGEDCALQPSGRRWSDAGCVLGPTRAVAWRILDAQYFGLAQRRRRVFVVASAREGFSPAEVLFESEGVRRDSAPSRETRQVAPTIPARSTGGDGLGTDFDCDGGLIPQPYTVGNTLTARMAKGINTTLDEGQTPVIAHAFDARQSGVLQYGHMTGPLDTHGHTIGICVTGKRTHALTANGADAGEDGTVRGVPIVPAVLAFDTTQITSAANYSKPKAGDPCHPPAAGAHAPAVCMAPVAFSAKDYGGDAMNDLSPTLRAGGHNTSHANAGVMPAVAFVQNQRDEVRVMEVAGALAAEPGMMQQTYVAQASSMQVRRLTPRECERLQGFPDDYTRIAWRGKPASECPDGSRYKALGNSWAVPVVRWIGRRIAAAVDAKAATV